MKTEDVIRKLIAFQITKTFQTMLKIVQIFQK